MTIKTILASVAVLAATTLSAQAATYGGDLTNGDVAPITRDDVYYMYVSTDLDDTMNKVTYGFTGVGNLYAMDTSGLNPDMSYNDLVVTWSSEAYGAGTVYASLSGSDVEASNVLKTMIGDGETQYLSASWSSVTGDASLLDFRVTADVPVPAAGFLLVGALGLLGAARRRKS